MLNDYISDNPGADETLEIKRCFAEGTRVRDDLVNALFGLRMRRADTRELGACIDGFPKTEGQVHYLKNVLKIEPNYVFVLDCPEESAQERFRVYDHQTSKKYTIEEAKQTGDIALLNRVAHAIEESTAAFKNRLEHWDTTKRDIFKGFESKVITIPVEKYTEDQIVERIEFTARKMRF